MKRTGIIVGTLRLLAAVSLAGPSFQTGTNSTHSAYLAKIADGGP